MEQMWKTKLLISDVLFKIISLFQTEFYEILLFLFVFWEMKILRDDFANLHISALTPVDWISTKLKQTIIFPLFLKMLT